MSATLPMTTLLTILNNPTAAKMLAATAEDNPSSMAWGAICTITAKVQNPRQKNIKKTIQKRPVPIACQKDIARFGRCPG